MKATLTLSFPFSASFTHDRRVIGRNYVLSIALNSVNLDQEDSIRRLIHQRLISRLHTTDFDSGGHLLSKCGRSDEELLRAIWDSSKAYLSNFEVKSLELKRDEFSSTKLIVSEPHDS